VPPSPPEPAERAPNPTEREVLELVARAEAHLAAERLDQAAHTAIQAAALRARLDLTLPLLARTLEAQGDGVAALDIWGQALDALPDDPAPGAEMGRLALKLGKHAVAETVLTRRLARWPGTPEAVAGLARAQMGQRAFDRAQATLTAALEADPGHAVLWSALGELLALQGRHQQAIVFFEEALRLAPDSAAGFDALADALLLGGGGDDRAADAGEAALAQGAPAELPRLAASHARRLLSMGRLAEGWNAFAQAVWPGDAAAVTVRLAAPMLSPEVAVEGRLLLMGETDVADELVLAHTLPRLVADGIAAGLVVHPSWQSLAARSFPSVMVVTRKEKVDGARRLVTAELESPHVHDGELIGAWAPLAALPARYAAAPDAFADAGPYLTPDPVRVDHWRERIAGLGPGRNVGLVWRAPGAATRPWEAPSMAQLHAALDVAGVRLIGLQAEDIQGELDWIRDRFGLPIASPPPELRIWDLDDVAALTMALDVTVGPPAAEAVVAAASGANAWLISPARDWRRLGAPAYAWLPHARVFAADGPDDWDRAMGELNAALTALAAGG